MSKIKTINKGFDLLRLGALPRCPAGLAPILHDVGVKAVSGKPVILAPSARSRFSARLQARFELSEKAMKAGHIPEQADRATLSALMADEKASRVKVSLDENRPSVLIRSIPGTDDFGLRGPIAIRPKDLASYGAKGVLCIENRQVFDALENLCFPILPKVEKHIAVFRGCPEYPQSGSETALKLAGIPVIVFPDYDPSGLSLAMSVPGMAEILWPGRRALIEAINSVGASQEKYMKQTPGSRRKLDSATHPDITEIWQILKGFGRVPAQEAFLSSVPDVEF
ncbi:MAG: hypothetical protein ABJN42_04885 [Roseibium sp.]|uniref:DUF7281 domain-containing protein n=1 Tax=Roseibium sp. TaxID=1936156 RepID=UPI00329820C5